MAWDEEWLSATRADPEQLTEYSLLPDRQAWKIFLFYVIIGLSFLIIIGSIGGEVGVFLGWPVILLIGLLMVAFYVLALCLLIWIPEKKREEV